MQSRMLNNDNDPSDIKGWQIASEIRIAPAPAMFCFWKDAVTAKSEVNVG